MYLSPLLLNEPVSKVIMQWVTSFAICDAYPIKLNISTRNRVTKVLSKESYCLFNCSLQYNKEKFSCRKHFKINRKFVISARILQTKKEIEHFSRQKHLGNSSKF